MTNRPPTTSRVPLLPSSIVRLSPAGKKHGEGKLRSSSGDVTEGDEILLLLWSRDTLRGNDFGTTSSTVPNWRVCIRTSEKLRVNGRLPSTYMGHDFLSAESLKF